MRLSEICIRRPVFATVMSLVVMLLGVVSYSRLPVREYPKIDEPVVSVQTIYRGASAEVVESQITKPLEDSLSGIEGVELFGTEGKICRSVVVPVTRLDELQRQHGGLGRDGNEFKQSIGGVQLTVFDLKALQLHDTEQLLDHPALRIPVDDLPGALGIAQRVRRQQAPVQRLAV